MNTASSPRSRDITRIHVLRSRLRLPEDDYRDLMASLYDGKRSSTELSDAQRSSFVHHLQRLADLQAPAGARGKPARRGPPLTPRQKKMFSLWQQLADRGLVTNRRMQALDTWVRSRQWLGERVDHKGWLSPRAEDQVIESLKRWLKRGIWEDAHGQP